MKNHMKLDYLALMRIEEVFYKKGRRIAGVEFDPHVFRPQILKEEKW